MSFSLSLLQTQQQTTNPECFVEGATAQLLRASWSLGG